MASLPNKELKFLQLYLLAPTTLPKTKAFRALPKITRWCYKITVLERGNYLTSMSILCQFYGICKILEAQLLCSPGSAVLPFLLACRINRCRAVCEICRFWSFAFRSALVNVIEILAELSEYWTVLKINLGR